MKELTIEEKAKAYDEAKIRISKAYNDNRCTIGFINEIFPELKESEDEKMKEMAEWKDEQFKQQLRQQEEKLLSAVETIVSLFAQTKSDYDFAMSIFKNEMINKNL